MTTNNEIELSAGEGNVAVKLRGSSVDRLTASLADLIAPFSEMAGAVADQVRLYREQNALRGLAAARDLAKTLNLEIKPVAPKFLVKWTEAVSLEETDGFQKLWAGLLLSESTSSSPAHVLYHRILTEMTVRHVELLLYVLEADHNNLSITIFSKLNPIEKLRRWMGESYYRNYPTGTVPSDIMNDVKNLRSAGCIAYELVLEKKDKAGEKTEIFKWKDSVVDEFQRDYTYKLLEMAGILESSSVYVSIDSEKVEYSNSVSGFVRSIYISSLGLDFLSACAGKAKL
ncbi:hypothetical protein NOJ05_05275 [Neorhizobium galegae]|uniref:Abi-alpha family protein n=1 Tax=Neorhizobium galegae TaxID=399 RepID=UPI0013547648|nr:hypothetical protein [Neorhizobium galegae]KAB1113145.1 hypothetical protein F4V89_14055 [Neorhizobium galegae]MCQ1776601.1 hypothetical protein [Neorhizobium galegae]MCQ1793935.1 hypothetical protein [Neorhizobium galegae]